MCSKNLYRQSQSESPAAMVQFFTSYNVEGEDLFDRIVTGDEKWVHHFTPQMKVY